MIEFFFDQHGDQRIDTVPKVETIYLLKELPPPAKKSPTKTQLDTWKDPKMYGVWIDGKELIIRNWQNTTRRISCLYSNSKLTKNAINYGKHYYQINLYTAKEYDEGLQDPVRPAQLCW